METLVFGHTQLSIEAGELVSFQVNKKELIHQKGSPGWRNSDTEMFPVIGPTSETQNRIQVPKGNAIQDQHGLLRELQYVLKSRTETKAIFGKTYKAGTVVKNSKFPDKSDSPLLVWPYSFEFEKSISVSEATVEISFTIRGDKEMPYMIGYHPAFKINTLKPLIKSEDKIISLTEILGVGNRAMEVADCQEIELIDDYELKISTGGFKHFMLWTEVPNMLCIEPITFYPYALPQSLLHEGFAYLDHSPVTFKVVMEFKEKSKGK